MLFPGRLRFPTETFGRDKFADDLGFASGVELTDYQRETIQFCLEREETPLYANLVIVLGPFRAISAGVSSYSPCHTRTSWCTCLSDADWCLVRLIFFDDFPSSGGSSSGKLAATPAVRLGTTVRSPRRHGSASRPSRASHDGSTVAFAFFGFGG